MKKKKKPVKQKKAGMEAEKKPSKKNLNEGELKNLQKELKARLKEIDNLKHELGIKQEKEVSSSKAKSLLEELKVPSLEALGKKIEREKK